MMKINILFIITEHLNTLSSQSPDGSQERSKRDILLFFGLPMILGVISYFFGVEAQEALYELSVSVFAIFSALLLSAQVAMYGVFKSDRRGLKDQVLDDEDRERAEEMRKLIREVNTNISYLIIISCLAVSVFLIFFAIKLPARLETGVLITIYAHFILTLSMVLKRAHLVFDSEYRTSLR